MIVSVVIPSYNSAKWLPRAIRSVLAQSRPADELIVVDDGSTDNAAEVCSQFSDRLRYVRRENGGLAAARNTGTAVSSGDWLLFLDADDTLTPNALESLSRAAEDSGAGVVYGFVLQRHARDVDAQLHSRPYAVGSPPTPAKANFWWTSICTAGSAFIRRSLNEAVGGFDEAFSQVEDCEYWLRCGVTAPFAHCGEMVLDKTYSPFSLGQQLEGSIWFRLQLQLKFLLWCRHRKIDTGFLDASEADIIDHALTRIHRQRCWSVLGPVLRIARRQNVRTAWYFRSFFLHKWLQATRRLPDESDRCKDVYRTWLDSEKGATSVVYSS